MIRRLICRRLSLLLFLSAFCPSCEKKPRPQPPRQFEHPLEIKMKQTFLPRWKELRDRRYPEQNLWRADKESVLSYYGSLNKSREGLPLTMTDEADLQKLAGEVNIFLNIRKGGKAGMVIFLPNGVPLFYPGQYWRTSAAPLKIKGYLSSGKKKRKHFEAELKKIENSWILVYREGAHSLLFKKEWRPPELILEGYGIKLRETLNAQNP